MSHRCHRMGDRVLVDWRSEHGFDEADALHEARYVGVRDRRGDVGAEHLTTERDMDLDHLGAEVVEVHVAFSREMFGPDIPASIPNADIAGLVQGIRFIEAMLAAPVDKDAVAHAMAPMRHLFTKSVVTKAALSSGT